MISAVKRLLWPVAVLLLALAFPLQVTLDDHRAALFAYVPLVLIYALPAARGGARPRTSARANGADLVVGFYLALIVGHLLWTLAAGEASAVEAGRQVFLFAVPASFYFYVARSAGERELRAMLFGIVIAALIVGAYFVYDSYEKIALHRISEYQLHAQRYGIERMGIDPRDASVTRIGVQYRSMGLLDSHTVSGAWIGFGALASFYFLRERTKIVRAVVGLGWFVMLVLGMNFTSILAFLAAVFVVHGWRGERIAEFLRVRRSTLRVAAVTALLALAAAWALSAYAGGFADRIWSLATAELSLIFTSRIDLDRQSSSFLAWTLTDTQTFFATMSDHWPSLIWGDGPIAARSWVRGGDVGFLDTTALLGVPFCLVLAFAFFRTIRVELRGLRSRASRALSAEESGFLGFGLAVMILIAVFEGHYSAWTYKSVSPILFSALGLIRRYGTGSAAASRPFPSAARG